MSIIVSSTVSSLLFYLLELYQVLLYTWLRGVINSCNKLCSDPQPCTTDLANTTDIYKQGRQVRWQFLQFLVTLILMYSHYNTLELLRVLLHCSLIAAKQREIRSTLYLTSWAHAGVWKLQIQYTLCQNITKEETATTAEHCSNNNNN